MPYKSESIPISGTLNDSRRKLSTEQVEAIKILHEKGYSYRKLATMFTCSKRSIQNIIKPQQRSSPTKKSTAYWTEAKRKYRQRKQELYQIGKISLSKRGKKCANKKPP